MGMTVCLCAHGPKYPEGGWLWIFLNWALGLRALGCQVIWLEAVSQGAAAHEIQADVAALRGLLERYGLEHCVALCSPTCAPLPRML